LAASKNPNIKKVDRMSIEFDDVNESLRRIRLTGRLDIPGTESISIKFASLSASSARRVVVDLTGVSFLASFGIRELITNAKAMQQRGGKMVLLVNKDDAIHKTMETTGVDSLIPLFTDAAEADAAAQA
jgi:anti-anti-sigma factor